MATIASRSQSPSCFSRFCHACGTGEAEMMCLTCGGCGIGKRSQLSQLVVQLPSQDSSSQRQALRRECLDQKLTSAASYGTRGSLILFGAKTQQKFCCSMVMIQSKRQVFLLGSVKVQEVTFTYLFVSLQLSDSTRWGVSDCFVYPVMRSTMAQITGFWRRYNWGAYQNKTTIWAIPN